MSASKDKMVPLSTRSSESQPRLPPSSPSVRQLVQRWDDRLSSPISPSQTATSSASLLTEFGTASPSHQHLKARATNAINGTLGPLDWTPKYGAVHHKKVSPLGSPIPFQASPSVTTNIAWPHVQNQATHLVPLRTVPPTPTIPSPGPPSKGVISDAPSVSPPYHPPLTVYPKEPAPPRPSLHLTTTIPTPIISPESRTHLDSPTSATRLLSSGNDVSPRAESFSEASAESHSSTDTYSGRAISPIKADFSPSTNQQHIFDLDAKIPAGAGVYLPSAFFQPRVTKRGRIPERASSVLNQAQPTVARDVRPMQSAWGPEDPDSIPLISRSLSAHEEKDHEEKVHEEKDQKVALEELDLPVCSETEATPIPADEVFKRDAPSIYLPELDKFLSNQMLFSEPNFTSSKLICTAEETDLFGLNDEEQVEIKGRDVDSRFLPADGETRGSKIGSKIGSNLRNRSMQVEIAGGQMHCPAELYSTSTSSSQSVLRQRKASEKAKQRGLARYRAPGPSMRENDIEAQTNSNDTTMAACQQDIQKEPDGDDNAAVRAKDQIEAEQVASRISARLHESRHTDQPPITRSELLPDGVSSRLSTRLNPLTRTSMFPPLMLLRDSSLDELKSNAIGPRKPPGGIWSVHWVGMIFDMIIGVEGSSFAAGLIRLEAFRDLFQMMALQLHFEDYVDPHPHTAAHKAARFLLKTLPALLGFDFVSVFGYALIFFVVWIVLTAVALLYFWRMTRAYNPNKSVEGFDSQGWVYKSASRGTRLANTCLVFVLGLLYLPLSKLAIDALVWSSDFWPVPNPYAGGIDHPEHPVPLGDPSVWREPLDFCYTTTMRKDAFNWAYIIVPLAVCTILFYTLWYPYKLMQVIREMVPRVSQYNELGRKRNKEEMKIQYHRLLNRDKSPFNFLYNSYRRQWGYYKPLYILLFKLTNLIVIVVLAKDNCLFRSFRLKTMLIVQQITLIVLMSVLLGIHLAVKPFVDKIGNRSEMVSRTGYVLTATIGLLVALNIQGSTVYRSTLLYSIQAFTYGGNIYFAIIGTSLAAHHVKQWQRRVDFTIDMFSPLLDINKHIKRRVWEETLSIVLLCGRPYHMPLDQTIAFSMSEEDKWPPYLIDFHGSVAERHIENLKIVKQIGIEKYRDEVDFCRTPAGIHRHKMIQDIQKHYTGPDAYWRPQHPPFPSGVVSYFGKAFVVPFPATLVMRYDEGSAYSLVLTETHEFEAFIEQNSSPEVSGKKVVRQALRALDGQRVLCPYVQNLRTGEEGVNEGRLGVSKALKSGSLGHQILARLSSGGRSRAKYEMTTPVSCMEGILKIERRREHEWSGYDFDSGFDVTIIFDKGRMRLANGALTSIRMMFEVRASRAIGLTEEFSLNPQLARFFEDNKTVVAERAPYVEKLLRRYRQEFAQEARDKVATLPYSFLTDVFDNDGLSPMGLRMALVDIGCRRTVRNLPILYEGSLTLMYERLAAINRSPVHRFWWLLFDELWRLNSSDYTALRKYRTSFCPQYPSSIAYRPMTRAALEDFLGKRGLWYKNGSAGGPFDRGLLNRIYFYLNEIAFGDHHDGMLNTNPGWAGQKKSERGRSGHRAELAQPDEQTSPQKMDSRLKRAATIHVGLGHEAKDAVRQGFTTVESVVSRPPRGLRGDSSTTPIHYTGGGTSYSNSSVVVRTAYVWEQRLSGHASDTGWQRFKIRALQWLALYPVETNFDRQKLFLYLELLPGPPDPKTGKPTYRYELLKETCQRAPPPS